jgi:hypothetical protein
MSETENKDMTEQIFDVLLPGVSLSAHNISKKFSISRRSAEVCIRELLEWERIEKTRDGHSTVYRRPEQRAPAAPVRDPWASYQHSREMLATIGRVGELRVYRSRF